MKKLNVILACALSVATVTALCACGSDPEPKKYTVIFDTRGGSAVSSYSLTAGSSIGRPKSVPTKDMFYFSDWYADVACTVKFDFANTKMPQYDITVYAGWLGESSVTVSYDANGGIYEGGATTYIEAGTVGATMSFPTVSPTNSGYVFGGWYSDAQCTTQYTPGTYPYDNITLYAKWDKDPEYVYVTYHGNGKEIKVMPVKKGAAVTEAELFGDDIVVGDWCTDAALASKYTFGSAASADVDLYTAYYTKGLTVNNGVVTDYDGTSTTVYVPHIYDGKNVTAIGAYAFNRSGEVDNVTRIILTDSIATLNEGAFYGCRYLTEINITDKISVIPDNAFWSNERLKSLGDISAVTSIGAAAFAGCKALRSIELPATLTEIGESAFAGCSTLTDVTLPALVTAIPNDAFSGCTMLERVTASAYNLTSIGERAFELCSALTSVTIQSAVVTNLAQISYNSPFHDCENVTVYVRSSLVPEYVATYGSWDNGALAGKFKSIG